MPTILLIEDTKSTIDLINTTLMEAGYKVYIALNGIQGVKIAMKLQPDLILLDILMPEMNGYEVCEILKNDQRTKDISIIFMSALTKTFDKVKAFQLGGVDYISKPIDIDEMLARVHAHVTIKTLQKQLLAMNEQLDEKVKQRTLELEEANKCLTETINELYNKSAALIRSEDRYRNITESITDYIYKVYISSNGSIETVHSTSCVSVTGYTKEELNKDEYLWFNIIYPDDRGKFNDFIHAFVSNPQNSHIEHRIITKKGEVKWVSNTILTFLDDKGALFEYDGIIKDITERKKLERQILNSIIETEEKERIRFSQEIHDGIGPILSSAKMYLQWAAETQNLETITKFLQKSTSLVDDATKASREISQKLSPHILQSFGLETALSNFIDNTKNARHLNINFSSNLKERFDAQKETVIYRVITESMNNTLKHAMASTITIALTVENDNLLLLYSDDGAGFDIDQVSLSKKGMGLFNMKNRVEALGGVYQLESSPGSGTCIRILMQI